LSAIGLAWISTCAGYQRLRSTGGSEAHSFQCDGLEWPALGVNRLSFNRFQRRVCAINHSPKDGVLGVEVRLLGIGDEELRFVGVRPRVGHGHHSSSAELECSSNLVRERLVPDRVAALALASWISCLSHEACNVAVEDAAIVIVRGTQGEEVLCCPWCCLAEDLDLELAQRGVERD